MHDVQPTELQPAAESNGETSLAEPGSSRQEKCKKQYFQTFSYTKILGRRRQMFKFSQVTKCNKY